MKVKIVGFIFLFMVLSACQNSPAKPVASADSEPVMAESVSTIEPTETQSPVPTKTFTLTPKPTSTMTPTIAPPEMLDQFLEGIQVKSLDTFENSASWNRYQSDTVSALNGELVMEGKTFWSSGAAYRDNFKEGQAVYFDYKYSQNPEFEMYFDVGAWENENYRRFGVYGFGNPMANLWQGANSLGWGYLIGNLDTRAETWYSILIAIGEDAEFLAVIWDPQDPSKYLVYNEVLNEKWFDKSWTFRLGANIGTINFDNFGILEFESIK